MRREVTTPEEYPDSIAWFRRSKHQEHFESTLEEDVSEIFFTQDEEDAGPEDWSVEPPP